MIFKSLQQYIIKESVEDDTGRFFDFSQYTIELFLRPD